MNFKHLSIGSVPRESRIGGILGIQSFMDAVNRRLAIRKRALGKAWRMRTSSLLRRRNRKYRELLSRERLLTAAVGHSWASIVITDARGAILYVNPAFERSTGYTLAELAGKTQNLLQSGQQSGEYYQRLWASIRGGNTWRGRIVNRKKDGQLMHEEMTISPIFNSARTITHYVGIKQDITRQMDMEQTRQLSQKLQAVGMLAAGIAHDFNNLLAPVLGLAELIQAQAAPQSDLHRDMQTILQTVERARGLVRKLIPAAPLAEGAMRDVDLAHTVRDVIALARRTFPESVRLVEDVSAALPPVRADESTLFMALMNLCANAGQAMPQGGKLRVTAREDTVRDLPVLSGNLVSGTVVRMEIADTGHGMDALTLSRMFEPFFTTRHGKGGSGLGLFGVYQVIQSLGGLIQVESKEGAGTQFTIVLPTADTKVTHPET